MDNAPNNLGSWAHYPKEKSLESLENLPRLFRKVSKSRETFKRRDFVNANVYLCNAVHVKNSPLGHNKYIILTYLRLDIYMLPNVSRSNTTSSYYNVLNCIHLQGRNFAKIIACNLKREILLLIRRLIMFLDM